MNQGPSLPIPTDDSNVRRQMGPLNPEHHHVSRLRIHHLAWREATFRRQCGPVLLRHQAIELLTECAAIRDATVDGKIMMRDAEVVADSQNKSNAVETEHGVPAHVDVRNADVSGSRFDYVLAQEHLELGVCKSASLPGMCGKPPNRSPLLNLLMQVAKVLSHPT